MENTRLSNIISIIAVTVGVMAIIGLGIYLSSTTNPTPKGKTSLRWCVDPNPIRKEQIKLFEASHPGISVINDPGAEAQRLLTQLAGDVPPDVMALYDPQTIRLFAKNGVLLDLTPYVSKLKSPSTSSIPAYHHIFITTAK